MNSLAATYHALGRHAEAARSSTRRRWRCTKAKLGPDHPDTLASMNNLANSYHALGRHADALKLYEETLALRKAKLGPDHPDTLTSMNNLADQLRRPRPARRGPASSTRRRCALQKAKLGPDHPDTLASMNNLADSYDALGRHADALKLREETLRARARPSSAPTTPTRSRA